MGRNSGGIMGSGRNASSGSKKLSIGMFGLTAHQLSEHGSAIKEQIAFYNERVAYWTEKFKSQLTSTLTDQQVGILKKWQSYFTEHKDAGTMGDFVGHIKQEVKAIDSGDFKKSALSMSGALVHSVIDGYAKARARRRIIMGLKLS